MPWTRRRKIVVVGTAVACVVVAGLFVPTAIGGWAPLLHWSCVSGGTVGSQVAWTPIILANAPYGGYVSGNATIPPGSIGNFGGITGEGSEIGNGSYGGVFERLFANVSENTNETVWGPGSSVRCGQRFSVTLASDYASYEGGMGNLGNWSDSNEPHTFVYATDNGEFSAYFDNGLTAPNMGNISTCDSPQKSLYMHSSGFGIWLDLSIHGKSTTVLDTLPFPGAYHYWFPANFGTWQVDNLSAPGDPGGGWAFSYSPCP